MLLVIGWQSLPSDQRELLQRETSKAETAAMQGAAAGAARSSTGVRVAVTSPSPIQRVVEAGQTVRTPCFEFEVSTKSTVTGDGCRVGVSAWTSRRAREVDYFTVELLNDDPPGMTLEEASQAILAGIQAGIARNPGVYRGENPGPYDADFGKYLGHAEASVAGRPAMELRWGLLQQAGKQVIDLGCPPDSATPCAAAPGLEAYTSVKYNTLVALPVERYTWDGRPLAWLLMTGWAKGHGWQHAKVARDSLRML